jgi:hypothetical protein
MHGKETKQKEKIPSNGSSEDKIPIAEKDPEVDPLDIIAYPEERETAFFRGEGFYVPMVLAERLCRLYEIDKEKLKFILGGTHSDCPSDRVSLDGTREFDTYEDYIRDFVEKVMEYERRVIPEEHLTGTFIPP